MYSFVCIDQHCVCVNGLSLLHVLFLCASYNTSCKLHQ